MNIVNSKISFGTKITIEDPVEVKQRLDCLSKNQLGELYSALKTIRDNSNDDILMILPDKRPSGTPDIWFTDCLYFL